MKPKTRSTVLMEKQRVSSSSHNDKVSLPCYSPHNYQPYTYFTVYMRDVGALAIEYKQPDLCELVRRFLYDQAHASDPAPDPGDDDAPVDSSSVDLSECPQLHGKIAVHCVAHATFYAPTELSGTSGMHRELIRANPSWRGHPRFDTVLINTDAEEIGMRGMAVGRVMGLMAIPHDGARYPCALIDWFEKLSDVPSDVTGMYEIQPELNEFVRQVSSIVHLDTIFRAVNLSPVFRGTVMPIDFHYSYSLDTFETFYINKYGDYHSHHCIY